MIDKQTIITLYRVNKLSRRAIARQLHLNRRTITKVIAEYETALQEEDPDGSLEALLSKPPVYDVGTRKKRVLIPEVIELVHKCMKENERKRSSGLKKQCMLKKDIYDLVVFKGYKVSYQSICRYMYSLEKDKKESGKEAFIRQYYNPGEVCEFDWGEVKLHYQGKLQRFFLAVFTLAHSNGRFACLFRHQNTLAFMEAHRNFFRWAGGVPGVLVYDNMRVAVKEFCGSQKSPTDALLRLSTFYRFHFRFCNIRAGWEKGHVERSVEYIRRKAFSLNLSFPSIAAAQEHLTRVCESLNREAASLSTENKQECFEADLKALQPYIRDMGCFELAEYKVTKWSTICMKGSHYSVPDTLVGQCVSVRIYSEKLVIFYRGEKVAVHERFYTGGRWSIRLEHYLNTLVRKPGALNGSVALRQVPECIQKIYNLHFKDNAKDFILLLLYAKEHGFTYSDIQKVYEEQVRKVSRRISADQIKLLLHTLGESTNLFPEVKSEDTEQACRIEENACELLNAITHIMENTIGQHL